MNTLIERIYQTGRVEDPDRGLVTPFPVSVPYETGALLYDVVFREGLDSTLEVGMAYAWHGMPPATTLPSVPSNAAHISSLVSGRVMSFGMTIVPGLLSL